MPELSRYLLLFALVLPAGFTGCADALPDETTASEATEATASHAAPASVTRTAELSLREPGSQPGALAIERVGFSREQPTEVWQATSCDDATRDCLEAVGASPDAEICGSPMELSRCRTTRPQPLPF